MLFCRAFCRFRHVTDLQVFNDDHRVVFADFTGDFVKVVPPDIGNVRMKALDFSLLFLPVCAELFFAA